MAKTFYGKLAATFYHPQKGAVRYSLKPEFIDQFGQFEFFAYRKKGIEPSKYRLQPQMKFYSGFMISRMMRFLKWRQNPTSSLLLSKGPSIRPNAACARNMYSSAMSGPKMDSLSVSPAQAMKQAQIRQRNLNLVDNDASISRYKWRKLSLPKNVKK